MISERTSLLQTVSTAGRPRSPYSWLRTTCSAVLLLVIIIGACLFAWPLFTKGISLEELQRILLETPNRHELELSSRYYTAGPHLAGQNYSQAVWTRDRWQEVGISSEIVAYDVYLNYPLQHRLALLDAHGLPSYECTLEEDTLPEDPATQLQNRVPVFHGYGANGNVTAPYVYVNFGTYQDFEDLRQAHVPLAGHIAIAKYGRNFRGLKVKRAQELGMVGVVMYSDPQEDGEIVEDNGYAPYPHGPARQPSSVQRGSVQFISILPGDPTTPGYASKPGAPRVDPDGSIPRIPSIPISYRDAIPLLKALNGHGPKSLNKFWEGGLLQGVDYNVGPSSLQLNLVAEHEYKITPIWNVIGQINGTLEHEVVILGNHRDAWIAGGAGDPNSGSAALNEVARGFGKALKAGWKPLRSIVLASWDGEEYGLLGSTEWVEDHMGWLKKNAVAYLNVDVGAAGAQFHASASPLLNDVLRTATDMVLGKSVQNISTIGSGSDFTAFQDFAGVPSLDMGFGSGKNEPVYHYHSNYDSEHWMEQYGDPGWKRHLAITQLWAVLAGTLASQPRLHYNATEYAVSLKRYVENINMTILEPLWRDVETLISAADAFERAKMEDSRANQVYKDFEKAFLHPEGLEGREQFKHVVFAPGLWTGYSGATLPGIVEAVEAGDDQRIEVRFR